MTRIWDSHNNSGRAEIEQIPRSCGNSIRNGGSFNSPLWFRFENNKVWNLQSWIDELTVNAGVSRAAYGLDLCLADVRGRCRCTVLRCCYSADMHSGFMQIRGGNC